LGHLRDRLDADLRLAGRSESTRKDYIGCAKLFVKYFNRPAEELGSAEVRVFLLHLHARKLSTGRRLQYLGALKFLYETTLARPDVTAGIPWPRARRRLPEVMTRDEVVQVLAHAPTPFWRVFMMTAYATGMRRKEVAALRAQDIDSTEGIVRVAHGKGDKRRDVMLDPELLAALRMHWRTQALPGPWLFPARQRGRPTEWADHPVALPHASVAFRRAADAAGLTRRMTLHSLRTAFATHSLEDGTDVLTLQQLLGHERIETTSRYAVVRTDRIRTTPSPLSKLPK
jgi:site-specific recombinase XerD